MRRFLSAYAAGGNAATLLESCLQQLTPLPSGATLGFLYATSATIPMLPSIIHQLRARLPGVEWLGCCGEGICSSGVEVYDQPAISLLLTDIPRQNFLHLASSDESLTHLPDDIESWSKQHPDCFGLLHAVPTYIASSTFAREIAEYAPRARLAGGLSSGAGQYRHIDNGVKEYGISGVLFSSEQAVLSAHAQGCTPIRENLAIDEAHQNMVLQLDGRPALQVLRETVGEVLWRNPQRLGNYIFIGLPTGQEIGGDYMIRNLMGVDEEAGAIAVGDLVERRSLLHFCRRDGNAAYGQMVAMLQRLQQQLQGREIRGGIYVSCVGRGRRQFGSDSEELKLIREQLGDFPLTGFFANGEFYNGRLYSYTGVLTLFL